MSGDSAIYFHFTTDPTTVWRTPNLIIPNRGQRYNIFIIIVIIIKPCLGARRDAKSETLSLLCFGGMRANFHPTWDRGDSGKNLVLTRKKPPTKTRASSLGLIFCQQNKFAAMFKRMRRWLVELVRWQGRDQLQTLEESVRLSVCLSV